MSQSFDRRSFHTAVLATGMRTLVADRTIAEPSVGPSVRGSSAPEIPFGVASGDPRAHSAVIWSRSDRPSQMLVEWSTTESFRQVTRIAGPAALANADYTAKFVLGGLPAGERIFYRVRFRDLASPKSIGPAVVGSFRTVPEAEEPRDLLIAWSGDTAGQGFGIDASRGGMRIYRTIREEEPDFFVHSGDYVYADNPMPAEIPLDDGSVWRNLVTPEKSKVAETLDEFRGAYRYNLLDANVRAFNAAVPQIVQWDDHETTNNWYPGEMLDDPRYAVRSCSLLAARGRRALVDYVPMRIDGSGRERIYRRFSAGSLVDVFVLDCRSYRGPNSGNRQQEPGPDTAFFGTEQLAWLKRNLVRSRATWKVICCDMPIGLVVRDGDAFENAANGDGPPLGREHEFADLFAFLQRRKVRNLVWLTADVHYAAALRYDPSRANRTDFDPFWEFVAGPMNAGTFGPNPIDSTFGPKVVFQSIPDEMKPNRPPSEGRQYYGLVRGRASDRSLTVSLHDIEGRKLFSVDLPPDGEASG